MSGMEKTYEMMWDCEYCGQKKLLGVTHRHCPECGAPQNPQKRYFPPENEKVAVEDHQFVGADVHCPSCRAAQSARVKHCGNCGGPMQGGAAAAQQSDQLVGPGGIIQAAPAPGAAPPKKKSSWLAIIIGLVVLAVVVLIVLRFVWKVETGVTVSRHTWVRQIAIERFDDVKEKKACNDMPSDAKDVVRSKGKKECKTRKIDQGDGTFKEKQECTEPVEQCSYTVTKWKVQRTLEEKGEGVDSTPKWPEVKLNRTGKCVGCEREGDRTESYLVHFKEAKSNDELSCSFSSANKWKSYEVGTSYKAEKHGLGGDLDCDSLKKGK